MRFVRVCILSHFCPRCDKFCHNSLIHQSKCHISYRNGIFVMTNIHGLHLRMTYLMSMTYKLNVPKIRIHEFSKLGITPNPPNPRKLQTGFYQIHNSCYSFCAENSYTRIFKIEATPQTRLIYENYRREL